MSKKILMYAVTTACLAVYVQNAYSANVYARMCVPRSATGTYPSSGQQYGIKWRRGSDIEGIGVCTNAETAHTADDITIKITDPGRANCYCKMLRPVVSKWVLGGDGLSNQDCMSACAGSCKNVAITAF